MTGCISPSDLSYSGCGGSISWTGIDMRALVMMREDVAGERATHVFLRKRA